MLNRIVTVTAVLLWTLLIGACQSTDAPTPVANTVLSTPTASGSLPQPSASATEVAVDTQPALTPPPQPTEPPVRTGEDSPQATATPTSTPTETPIPAAPVDEIQLLPVVQGAFVRPLYLTHANDDRLFVVEEPGLIRIVRNNMVQEQPFLDIRDRVNSVALERGLLGLAFDPQYDENGYFYVNYSNLNGDNHISRFKVSGSNSDLADSQSETVLLTIDQPYENHNGGQLAFGPDGYLYIGVGDGGSANDPLLSGQDLGSLLGTILRVDVKDGGVGYAIPASNPFVGDPQRLDEIWAWGLRNPWRFSFDRSTGDLFIADVGQNLWEEVHFQEAQSGGGENYGWNIMEGSHCFMAETCNSSGLEVPIFEYSHSEGCSITGGYMYRGSAFPALYGNYFTADYCQGKIWRLFRDDEGNWLPSLVLDTDLVISSFGEDAFGELYVLDHVNGSLYQIRD